MIVLPAGIAPMAATPSLMDFGGVIRPATGGEVLHLRRNGNRFRVAIVIAPGPAARRQVIISRLLAAKNEGIRVPYPLQRVNQSGGGPLVMNGANQTGASINLRAGASGFVIREGFWLSIQRADGRHYLHNVRGDATIGGGGTVTVPISPNLRYPFPDGALVHLTQPMIEGLIPDDISWNLQLGRIVDGIGFTIEEVA